MIEYNTNLFLRNARNPFDKLRSRSPILKVFKECGNRDTRPAEYPRSADSGDGDRTRDRQLGKLDDD